MTQYENFTSLPPDKERTFVVYEKTTTEALQKAKMLALIVAAVFGIITIVIVFSFEKPENLMANDDMGMLQKSDEEKAKKEAPKKKEVAPDPAPAEDKSADDKKDGDDSADDDADEAKKDEAESGDEGEKKDE